MQLFTIWARATISLGNSATTCRHHDGFFTNINININMNWLWKRLKIRETEWSPYWRRIYLTDELNSKVSYCDRCGMVEGVVKLELSSTYHPVSILRYCCPLPVVGSICKSNIQIASQNADKTGGSVNSIPIIYPYLKNGWLEYSVIFCWDIGSSVIKGWTSC